MVHQSHRLAFAKHMFLTEIAFQAQMAESAAVRLPDGRTPFSSIEAWGAIQSVLAAAANISKILWPSPKAEYAARGPMLRALLAIDEQHILSSRDLRNHFEHYDERIESWLSSTESSNYTDQIIGELPCFLAQFPQNAHRHYDPNSRTLTFRGLSIDLGQVLAAMADIRVKCQQVVFL